MLYRPVWELLSQAIRPELNGDSNLVYMHTIKDRSLTGGVVDYLDGVREIKTLTKHTKPRGIILFNGRRVFFFLLGNRREGIERRRNNRVKRAHGTDFYTLLFLYANPKINNNVL